MADWVADLEAEHKSVPVCCVRGVVCRGNPANVLLHCVEQMTCDFRNFFRIICSVTGLLQMNVAE